MRNAMLLAVLMVAACGGGEGVPDDALVEGTWYGSFDRGACAGPFGNLALMPQIDVEVESDGDVTATCDDCFGLAYEVRASDSLVLEWNDDVGHVVLDATDDGMFARGTITLMAGGCETVDESPSIQRIRE